MDTDPSVYNETAHPRATAWFKESATHLLDRVPPYLAILSAHGVECVRVESDDPGARDLRGPRSDRRRAPPRPDRVDLG